MILKGSQRAGAKALADHLMNLRDNDHVDILELRGFSSNDLHGCLSEAHAISKATCCKQFMFSLSLNPPPDHIATEDELLDAANRAEDKLGLSGQPRAIIIHEKEGRRHAHAVWSRIDADTMKAINLPHFKMKLRDVSRELFLDHGWMLPDGLASYGNKSPLNFTLEEWQQAKRQGIDPREIKQTFRQAWERSDSQIGFKNALEERGYFLAKGDRRGFVALDVDGNIYAIPKWASLKAKEVRDKLGSPETLPSVEETKSIIHSRVTDQMRGYIAEIKERHDREFDPLRDEHRAMTKAHRLERQCLKDGQEKRWIEETKARSDRLNTGFRGLFDRLTGKARTIRSENEADALRCAKRDQEQRDALIVAQMRERQELQEKVKELKEQQSKERQILARDIASIAWAKSAEGQEAYQSTLQQQRRARDQGPDMM